MDNTTVLQSCLLSNFYNRITVQLDDSNYVSWRFMLESMLVGCDLMGYIDGSIPCPSQYKITKEGNITSELTQEYTDWRKNDSALMALLAGTLSHNALSFIVGSKTSKEVWFSLYERYGKLSKFKAFKLQTSMQKIQKGKDSIDKYMERFKTVRDQLSVAGIHIPDDDVVTFILNGLPAAFTTFKIVIRAQETPISLTQLHTLLLDFESDIVQELSSLASTPVPISVENQSSGTDSSSLVSAPVTTSLENQSPGTHLTTQLTYVPQHTVLPNNTNHVASAFTMNPTYSVNATMQNGNFGVPLMSNYGHMVTSTPNLSAGSVVYLNGSNVVPTNEVVYNCGTSQPNTGLIHQIGTHPSSQVAQPAGYCNSTVGAYKYFDQRRRARIHYQNGGWNCYRNQNNGYTQVRTSSLNDKSEISNPPDACQICNNKGHTAQVCSQRSCPRQVVAFGFSLQWQICFKRGHSAAECFHRHHYDFQSPSCSKFHDKAASFSCKPSSCLSSQFVSLIPPS